MTESLCFPPETITALLMGYIPIQNKKVKKTYNKKYNFKKYVNYLIKINKRY